MRRLLALTYESLLLSALILALGFALLPFSGITGSSDEFASLEPLVRAGWFACVFAVCGAYYVGQWSDGRRTLPMKAWRLYLQTISGTPPPVPQAMLRYLAWWVGPTIAIGMWILLKPYGHERWAFCALTFNYAWALFDPDHSFLHDRIAGTRIATISR